MPSWRRIWRNLVALTLLLGSAALAQPGPVVVLEVPAGPAAQRIATRLATALLAEQLEILEVPRRPGANSALATARARGAAVVVEMGRPSASGVLFAVRSLRGAVLARERVKLRRGALDPAAAARVARTVARLAEHSRPVVASPPDTEPAAPIAPPTAVLEVPVVLSPPAPTARRPSAEAATTVPASRPPPPQPPEAKDATPVAARDRSWSEPWLEVSAGAITLWRQHTFCPRVVACGAAPSEEVRFVTLSPYVAPRVSVAFFPFAGPSRWRGLGLLGHYARGRLRTQLEDETGAVQTLETHDEDLALALAYRAHRALPTGSGYLGVRIGAGRRHFQLPPSVLGTQSERRISPQLTLDVGAPVWEPWVRVELSARWTLFPSPGQTEQEAYGGQRLSADGYGATLGLSGRLWGGLGYTLAADYVLYLDQFAGQGARADGGAAREEYAGVSGSVTYAF